MLDKLEEIEKKYNHLQDQLCDIENMKNTQKLIEINKEVSKIEEIHNLYIEYKKALKKNKDSKEILNTECDEEIIELAKEDLYDSEKQILDIENQIQIALLPKDPNDDKDIFLEIRPAAGGDEAGLFGTELLRMYLRYAELKGWKPQIVENESSDIGGVKSAIIKIAGEKVYSKLKYESGVHRVQRIPETEAKGRIHTSTITVVVLPEVEDIEIDIKPEDISMDTYAASSAGGQNANKNQTGVRIHHKPTGIIVNIGDSKSQLQNKEKAYSVLKAKLYQIEMDKQTSDLKNKRLNQIGNGDRSEKIRTYNFPQDRITDHRIKKSWSNINYVLEGYLDDIINDLNIANQSLLLGTIESENDLD